MSGMRLIRGVDTHTVVADGYQLFLRDAALGAVVADAEGHAWSRLSLLASLNRVDMADESYDLSAVRITEHDDGIDLELTASTPAWTSKTVRLRCRADRIEYSVQVTGRGTLADDLARTEQARADGGERHQCGGREHDRVESARVQQDGFDDPAQRRDLPDGGQHDGEVKDDRPAAEHWAPLSLRGRS